MLSAADLARMQADLQEVIGDNEVSIIIRRNSTTLPAQTVRVERRAGFVRKEGDQTAETRGKIFVAGGLDLDIALEDRFNVDGRLYKVTFVRPNTQMGVMADAELIQ